MPNPNALNALNKNTDDVDPLDNELENSFNDIFGDHPEEPDVQDKPDVLPEGDEVVDAAAEAGKAETEADKAAQIPEDETVPEEPVAETPASEAAKPAEEAAKVEVPEAQKPVPVQEQPAPQAPEPAPTLSQEQLVQQYQSWRDNAEKALETHYALTPEQAEMMQTEPEKALPKLASRLHMEVMQATLTALSQMMPGMIQQYTSQSSANNAAESRFFAKWPELKGHDNVIKQFGLAYRQINPKGTEEDFINTVGIQASVHLKKPIPGYGAQPAPASVTPATRQIPPKPAAAMGGPGGKKFVPQEQSFAGGVFETADIAVDDDE